MKKTSVLIAIAIIMISFTGCFTTSEVFGSKGSTTLDVNVYVDEFSGDKTYEYSKGLRGGFALSRGGLSADYLEFFPYLKVNEDNVCTPILKIVYRGSSGGMLKTGSDKTYHRFIFLNSEKKRLEINHDENPEKESELEQFGDSYGINRTGEYQLILTKSQFDILKDFFSNSDNIKCAAYSTDNKVVTFSSYNNKWHQGVFSALDNCIKEDNPNVIYNEIYTQVKVK